MGGHIQAGNLDSRGIDFQADKPDPGQLLQQTDPDGPATGTQFCGTQVVGQEGPHSFRFLRCKTAQEHGRGAEEAFFSCEAAVGFYGDHGWLVGR